MNVKLLFYILVFILISCNSNETSSLVKNKSKISKEVNHSLSKTEVEDFVIFFDNFTSDKKLQKERMIFPFEYKGKVILSPILWKGLDYFKGADYFAKLNYDSLDIYFDSFNTHKILLSLCNLNKSSILEHDFYFSDSIWKLKSLKEKKVDVLQDKEFLNFLKRFSTDSVFQKERTVFPFIYVTYDDQDFEKDLIKYIQKDSVNFEDMLPYFDNLLICDSEFINSNFRSIVLRGKDNGIHVRFYFKKIRNKWFHFKLLDYST